MVKNSALLKAFERECIRAGKPDHKRALRGAEALYRQAAAAGGFTRRNPLAGIEAKIRLAEALKHV